ncbi:MAG: hypothetical protein DMF63_13610 [Acidobacteria bacterium]|nr:MAG: hypothetical protein DMF63_13610 [Acidobacteriota bacterium]
MSFDTVIFKKGIKPLDSLYWKDVGFVRAKNGRLVRNCDRTNMTVYQKGFGGKDWLMVQSSLPKIVFGHNATLPTEAQAREAASWLCGYVSSETGLTFRIDDVKAFRIDYTRDYDVREDRTRRVALSLFASDLPDFPRANREKDSVCFSREREGQVIKAITVYPKFAWAAETGQPPSVIRASRGKLRLEVRLMRKGLAGIKGARKPLDYLSQSVSDSLLNQAANMLDLQRIIDARNIDFHRRLIIHGCGQRSLGKDGLSMFVELVKRHGPHFYLNPEFCYPKSTYFKRKKEAEQLGVWGDLVASSEMQRSYE